jgi:hypothetical protein
MKSRLQSLHTNSHVQLHFTNLSEWIPSIPFISDLIYGPSWGLQVACKTGPKFWLIIFHYLFIHPSHHKNSILCVQIPNKRLKDHCRHKLKWFEQYGSLVYLPRLTWTCSFGFPLNQPQKCYFMKVVFLLNGQYAYPRCITYRLCVLALTFNCRLNQSCSNLKISCLYHDLLCVNF